MDVSTTTAVLMILGGLVGLILLLRALNAATLPGSEPEVKHAVKNLTAVTAALKQHRRRGTARVTPADVRRTIDSIGGCIRALRRTAGQSHAAALASVEKSVTLLSSVLEPPPQRARPLQAHSRKRVRTRS